MLTWYQVILSVTLPIEIFVTLLSFESAIRLNESELVPKYANDIF